MKRTIITFFLLIVAAGAARAQGVQITFAPEGVQTVTENTTLLLADPLIDQTTFYTPPAFLQKQHEASGAVPGEEGAQPPLGLDVGLEFQVSPENKSLVLPLGYTWKSLHIGASLPYIMQRRMKYSAGTKEAAGLGDISINLGYSGAGSSLNYHAALFAKLPTGDDENQVEGYLVPLGTGSTDLVFTLAALKTFERFSLSGNILYRLNGSGEKIVEMVYPGSADSLETITYDIRNGNIFSCTAGLDYYLAPKWILGLTADLMIVGEGTTDARHSFSWNASAYEVADVSNKQDMTLLDLTPNVSYYLWMTDLMLLAKIPVITERHEANKEAERDMTLLFKLSRSF